MKFLIAFFAFGSFAAVAADSTVNDPTPVVRNEQTPTGVEIPSIHITGLNEGWPQLTIIGGSVPTVTGQEGTIKL